MAIEDCIGKVARRKTVTRAHHQLESGIRPAVPLRNERVVKLGLRLTGGAEDHAVAAQSFDGIAQPARIHPGLRPGRAPVAVAEQVVKQNLDPGCSILRFLHPMADALPDALLAHHPAQVEAF